LEFTRATYPGGLYETNWHHRLLCTELERIQSGEIKRLMVFMPPQHGKSELVSRRFPAWVLGRNPNEQLIACAYNSDWARNLGRDVKNLMASDAYREIFGIELARATVDNAAINSAKQFQIAGHRGRYRPAGVGEGITGMGATLGIIDDPIKDNVEAESAVERNRVWEWYTTTFLTRIWKEGRIVITLTRWHEDDLAGRILNSKDAESWQVLSLPGIAEAPMHPNDPRELGQAMWPYRADAEELNIRRETMGEYKFGAMYQQRPSPRTGAFFATDCLKVVDTVPAGLMICRAWDMAATAGGGDYTAAVKIGLHPDGRVFVLDVFRAQLDSGDRDDAVRNIAGQDGRECIQRFPVDPGSAGKDSAVRWVRMLHGYSARIGRVTGSKITRADPFASQVKAGNVHILRAPWNAMFVEELRAFPAGKYDDQVDAAADAYAELVGAGTKPTFNLTRG